MQIAARHAKICSKMYSPVAIQVMEPISQISKNVSGMKIMMNTSLREFYKRHVRLFYALYIILGAAFSVIGYVRAYIISGGASLCANDFGNVFLPSASFVAAGHPLEMYAVRVGLYPNANGPLGEMVIGGFLKIGYLLGLERIGQPCQITTLEMYWYDDTVTLRLWFIAIFALLYFVLVLLLLDLIRKRNDHTFSLFEQVFIAILLIVSPSMYDCLVFYGHYEIIIELLCAVMGLRAFLQNRRAEAGIWIGLAALTRTASLFIAIPLAVALAVNRKWKDCILFAGSSFVTLMVGLLPFLWKSRYDTIYSLVTFRSAEPILDGSFWTFLRNTHIGALLQNYDSTLAIVFAVTVSAAVIIFGKIRDTDPLLTGVIVISQLFFAFFLRATWGYYFSESFVMGLLFVFMAAPKGVRFWMSTVFVLYFSALTGITEYRINQTPDFFGESGRVRLLVEWTSAGVAVLMALGILLLTGYILFLARNSRKKSDHEVEALNTAELMHMQPVVPAEA